MSTGPVNHSSMSIAARRGLTIRRTLVLLLAGSLLLAGCLPAPPDDETTPPPTDSAGDPLAAYAAGIRDAFQSEDISQRREAIGAAVGAFLSQASLEEGLTDAEAADLMATAALSSGRLRVPGPVHVHCRDQACVVNLPDALGLVLYDLSAPENPPLEITRWTLGLSQMEVTWGEGEAGVSYTRQAADGSSTAHFILIVHGEEGWRVAWAGDEQPDWWMNARNAVLSVTPDLATVTVIGEAPASAPLFNEGEGAPRRTFRMVWERSQETIGYRAATPSQSYRAHHEWLWATAQPSPYATLVEVIERLVLDNRDGLTRLVTSEGLLTVAGRENLHLPSRRYRVLQYDAEAGRIVFQVEGEETTLSASFAPPAGPGQPWRLSSIGPAGGGSTSDEQQEG
ncbi:MAG: hypothetical protein Kow00124_03660 [Anaerolineae bacterium]